VRATLVLAAIAIGAALIPLPPATVERWYSRGFYPPLQQGLTRASNVVPIALLDVAVVTLAFACVALLVRRWRRDGASKALRASGMALVRVASALYLAFLLLWGFNYQRLPLEAKLTYDASRVNRDSTFRLAETAVDQVNILEKSRTAGAPVDRQALEAAFARAQQQLSTSGPAVAAPPKTSMFSWYLRTAGIDGMMNPFFLEIILNPDILPAERPFSLAHEWAHLAGYANESEANFVSWLTCIAAAPDAQYSGWLEAYRYASAALPAADRRALQQRLSPEVIRDLRAINERLGRADPHVSGFARNVYDSYLRAQGMSEGIASYGAMLRLMVGTTFENGWVPQLRR
jgi:hypothetical protein